MLEIRHLTKRFGAVVGTEDLTFDVRPGVVTGFLGPNGAGKSTTLRMVLGLITPDSGSARVAGRAYRDLRRPLCEVGSLLAPEAVHPARSAAGHLRWIAATQGISAARVDEVLGLTGLTAVAGRRLRTFSLGMRQRLGIAAALLGDPHTVLLDEPANGLDPDGIRWTRALLAGLGAEGRTVLVSSHAIGELATVAQHVVVIGHGRLLTESAVADLTAGGRSLEDAYFALTGGAVEYW